MKQNKFVRLGSAVLGGALVLAVSSFTSAQAVASDAYCVARAIVDPEESVDGRVHVLTEAARWVPQGETVEFLGTEHSFKDSDGYRYELSGRFSSTVAGPAARVAIRERGADPARRTELGPEILSIATIGNHSESRALSDQIHVWVSCAKLER